MTDSEMIRGMRSTSTSHHGRQRIQLTLRGAITGLFLLCLVSLLLSAWTGWTGLSNLSFVAGCALATGYAKPEALRWIAVTPPIIFFFACLVAEYLTTTGKIGLAEGLVFALGPASAWLITGTAVAGAIAVRRGAADEFLRRSARRIQALREGRVQAPREEGTRQAPGPRPRQPPARTRQPAAAQPAGAARRSAAPGAERRPSVPLPPRSR